MNKILLCCHVINCSFCSWGKNCSKSSLYQFNLSRIPHLVFLGLDPRIQKSIQEQKSYPKWICWSASWEAFWILASSARKTNREAWGPDKVLEHAPQQNYTGQLWNWGRGSRSNLHSLNDRLKWSRHCHKFLIMVTHVSILFVRYCSIANVLFTCSIPNCCSALSLISSPKLRLILNSSQFSQLPTTP